MKYPPNFIRTGFRKRKFLKFTFLFLTIFSFGLFISNIGSKSINIPLRNKSCQLLELLHDKNVFLVDIDKLKEISIHKKSNYLQLDFSKFLQAGANVSFGIFADDVRNILNQACTLN